MDTQKIIISIITVNLNNANGLRKTINSVRCQTNKNYELIIIDGKSTDNSLDVIKSNTDIIHYYISEPDSGLFDAMNKGLEYAAGDFTLFLNTGDTFYDNNVLNELVNTIIDFNTVYFGVAKIAKDNESFYFYPKLNSTENDIISFLKYHKPNHQAMMFPKKFYASARYDIQYKIASDEDYKIRAIKSCGYIFVNRIIVSFQTGGISYPNSLSKVNRIVYERSKIHKIYGIYTLKNHIRFSLSMFIKYFFNKLFGNKL